MSKQQTNNRPAGLVLILLGVIFLVEQFRPGLLNSFSWPWVIIAVGAIFLLTALFTREGAFAIPGSIVGGIGSLLLWQNSTGNWESWAYAWTLIPGFAAIGIILANLLGHRTSRSLSHGLLLLVLSAGAFVVFAGMVSIGPVFVQFWPVLLILAGLGMLVRAFLRPA